jgi:hypothetical protein
MRRLIVAFLVISSTAAVSVSPVESAAATGKMTLTLVKSVADNSVATKSLGTPGWSTVANNGRSATFEYSDQKVKGEYKWAIPATIPDDGAPLTLNATATDQSGYRMYAYIGVNGSYGTVKDGSGPRLEIQAEADHNAGKDTANVTKTVTILPATVPDDSECNCVLMTLQLGPSGPLMTYTYKHLAEKEQDFRFHVTARPSDSEGLPPRIFSVEARGQGSKHTVGDLSSSEGTVKVDANWAHDLDELTTLKLKGSTYYPPDRRKGPHIVSVILQVKDSNVDDCEAGLLGRLRLTDYHDADEADHIVLKYCGRTWIWRGKPSDRLAVHVNAK